MTRIKQWFNRYKHYLSLGVLVGGFVFDNIALRHASLPTVELALAGYLVFVGAAIIIFSFRPYQWLLYLIQFSFGNLFSGFFILYFYSAPWTISWPFLIVLFFVFLSSEFGKKHYLRLSFQLIIFYLALFSFFILFLPIMLGKISAPVFLLSGLVSLAAMAGFLVLIARMTPSLFAQAKERLKWGIGATFVLLNVFYFTNILPPIPLALKEAGVYHSITHSGNDFWAQAEKLVWWRSLYPYPTLHLAPGESAYVYGAIFAPTKISTGIVHHWQYYDEGKREWVSRNKVNIAIVGGREAGYRSYSSLRAPALGWWRVNIETSRGQVIGRQEFKVKRVEQSPSLETIKL